MATREENLKKINDDLEKLSDEQLEQIAGGKITNGEIPNYDTYTRFDDKTGDLVKNI